MLFCIARNVVILFQDGGSVCSNFAEDSLSRGTNKETDTHMYYRCNIRGTQKIQ